MKIAELTATPLVHLDVTWGTKQEVLDELIHSLAADGAVTDAAAFSAAVSEREAHGPTGMQDGLAIPHGKSGAVNAARVAMARLAEPI
ncbi:MAG TPA: PTS sugar transporter subunit IIA, partial [Dermatophilaceae bacterium]|nr:PTS sugar transporter subunit IIA [Dermatophilaceae bacterium]